MYVVINILLYVSINKVMSAKYFVESTRYLCMSRCSRNGTSGRSKTSIEYFQYKNSKCVNIKIPNRCMTCRVSIPSHKMILKRIFSKFQLCIGWGEGELQENFEKDALS